MRRVALNVLTVVCLVTASVAPAAAVAGGTDGAAASQAASETRTVTLLTYNDIQTAAAKDDRFPRLYTAIEQRRGDDTVVLGAGDEVSPHALSAVSKYRAPVDVLNELDPAADVIGNHEFDWGYEEVGNITARSEFPWLATNVVDNETGEPVLGTEEYTVVERNGVRIGVIGLIDRGAAEGKTNVDLSEQGATLENYTVDGPRTAERLREEENVDVVVAVAHTGIGDAKTLARADESDAIDVIAVGDDEVKYPPNETAGSIITEAQGRAAFLGELELQVDTEADDVTSWDGQLVTIDESIPKNDTASQIITDYRSEVSLDSTVATTTTPLDARFSTNYHRESAYGNLVTDAMRAETGATVAVTNAGGIRSNAVYGANATADDPANVTGGDVFNTLPFPNTLVTFEMTGEQLKGLLASQVVTLESETGQQYGEEISQQVSGVRFEWVPHEDASPQIRDVYVNRAGPTEPADWEPLRNNESYTVTVNSYMASGGSGYPLPANKTVVSRTDKLLAVTVIDYLERRGQVGPTVEGRMERVDRDIGDAQVYTDGRGQVVLTYEPPSDLRSLAPETVELSASGAGVGTVTPEQVTATEGQVIVRFDDDALHEYVERADGRAELDLYAEYTSSEYAANRTYFERSRLNSDVTVVRHPALDMAESAAVAPS